jgi:glycosyltransferase involved in cell wall biosynthesis
MREVVFAIPGDIDTPTGGYRYDRRVMDLLPQQGWNVRHLPLPGDYPSPSEVSLANTVKMIAEAPDALVMIDGLAFGAMPMEYVKQIPQPIVALVHHPLALETGIDAGRAKYLEKTEREALTRAVHVLATSEATADILVSDFGVPKNSVSFAEPGTDPAPRAEGSGGIPRLVSVGSVTARKGYDVLVAALARIKDLKWESRIAGRIERDLAAARLVRDAIAKNGLQERVHLLGSLPDDALDQEYKKADLFVLPSHFEGYGMAFAEALSRGLPVVGCAGGAVVNTVPADTGILVPPGDDNALADALRKLLTDKSQLQRRADAAWSYAKKLPTWNDTAARVAKALDKASAGVSA